ncbi:cytosine permease [Glaciihabitans sp. dw_435]|uniref:cytosine permease n=1 Tax=Glaciihabitans sp. dw_435 TaxID=2720081 RepID=UPI001BD4BB94|nr:cytosine permease [Glaciihabitans sp. dw_435]
MADDDPREDEQTELFAPPGPRRSTYTAPKNDEAMLRNAANVFSDDDLAEALAEQFGPSKAAAAASRHRSPGAPVDAPSPSPTPPADVPEAPPALGDASQGAAELAPEPEAVEHRAAPEAPEHHAGSHVAEDASTPDAALTSPTGPLADDAEPAAEHPAPSHAAEPSGKDAAPTHAAEPSGEDAAPTHAVEPSVEHAAPAHIAERASDDALASDDLISEVPSTGSDAEPDVTAVATAAPSRFAPEQTTTTPIDFDDAAYKRPRRHSREQTAAAAAATAAVAPAEAAAPLADSDTAAPSDGQTVAVADEAPVEASTEASVPSQDLPASPDDQASSTDQVAPNDFVSAFDALLAEPSAPKQASPEVAPPVWLFARDVAEPVAPTVLPGTPDAAVSASDVEAVDSAADADNVLPDEGTDSPADADNVLSDGAADSPDDAADSETGIKGDGVETDADVDAAEDVDSVASVENAETEAASVETSVVAAETAPTPGGEDVLEVEEDLAMDDELVVASASDASDDDDLIDDDLTDMDALFGAVMAMGPEVVDMPAETGSSDTAEVPVAVSSGPTAVVVPDHTDTRETAVLEAPAPADVPGTSPVQDPFASPASAPNSVAPNPAAPNPVAPTPSAPTPTSSGPVSATTDVAAETAAGVGAVSAVARPGASARRSPFEAEEVGEEPTPRELRVGRAARLFWLWFAANSSLVSVAFGAIIFSLGMSLRQAIVSILAGVALSFLPLGLGTLASKRSGQPTMVVSRATFGVVGNILPAVIALISRLFWGAALLWILSAGTASILVGADLAGNFSVEQVTLLTMAIGFLIALVIAFFGYHILARVQLVLSVVSAVLIVGFIALTAGALHVSVALTVPDGSWSLLLTGAVLVFSFVGLVWANSSGDLARYQRSSTSSGGSMLWATFGTALPSFVLIAYGTLLAASSPAVAAGLVTSPFDAMGDLLPSWYPIPLVAATALSLLSGVAIALYSSAFALQATRIRGSRPLFVVLLGVVLAVIAGALALTASGFESVFRDFATTLAVPVAAWAGIFASDTMIRNRRYDTASLLRRGGVYDDFRWVNVSMLVIASVVGLGFTSATVGWLGWEGYFFELLGVAADSPVAGTDVGVLIALFIGVVTPLVSGVRAVRRQEIVRS